jgi:hypothetical protein
MVRDYKRHEGSFEPLNLKMKYINIKTAQWNFLCMSSTIILSVSCLQFVYCYLLAGKQADGQTL